MKVFLIYFGLAVVAILLGFLAAKQAAVQIAALGVPIAAGNPISQNPNRDGILHQMQAGKI